MSSGISFVDKIFVINLDHNVDRLENFSHLMDSLGYQFERFKAVNGQQYEPTYITRGEYGCFLSHFSLWKRVASDPTISRAIIFEDDVILSPKLESVTRAKELIEDCISNYSCDIFYLGKCLDRCDLHKNATPGIVRTNSPLCAHAYALSKEGAKKLISYYKKSMKSIKSLSPLSKTIVGPKHSADVFMKVCIKEKQMLVYASHPSIFVQNTICYSSNMRNKIVSSIFNSSECCVPQYVVYIYIFVILITVLFIFTSLVWVFTRKK